MKKIMIQDMPNHIGETVKLGVWLSNKRSSGKIAFLQLRDGSGFVQGVIVKRGSRGRTICDSKKV